MTEMKDNQLLFSWPILCHSTQTLYGLYSAIKRCPLDVIMQGPNITMIPALKKNP